MRRLLFPLLLVGATPGAALAEPPGSGKPFVPKEADDGSAKAKLSDGKEEKAAEMAPPDPVGAPAVVPTTYQGVGLGADHPPPRAPRLPVKGPVRVTWPGFQVRAGTPVVFLQLTGTVDWSVTEAPDKLVYTLRGASVPLANNRRVLPVGDFGTAVKAIEARQKGRTVDVTVRLRDKVQHRERIEDGAGGFKFLVIELPAS